VLPAPDTVGRLALEHAIGTRRSVRHFTGTPLALAEIGQLLWSAQGVTSATGRRTAPSAGALYAVEAYAAAADRTLHYLPAGHRAEVWAERDLRAELIEAGGSQGALQAPMLLVISVVPGRLAERYGSRAERFADLEAGHVTQNVLLQAGALHLGAVPVGSFDDRRLVDALGLPDGENPRYLVPVGHPAG